MHPRESKREPTDFGELFHRSTDNSSFPFPFQERFALSEQIPSLVNVPTGLGKTAMAVLGWLWRRQFADRKKRDSTPRRLVYCLPMRVLVEQTRENAIRWLHNLCRLGGHVDFDPPLKSDECATVNHRVRTYTPCTDDPSKVAVHVLMGGEDENEWDIHPDRDAMIIGTQDMLLSRALNRGYAANRSRWPMQFGMLHTDCLWVFDEIQLMGSGLATTAQLEAFRHRLGSKDGHGCRSVWMSATLDEKWLETVDFKAVLSDLPEYARFRFNYQEEAASPDINPKAKKALEDRWTAKKPLQKAGAAMGDAAALAREVVEAHKAGTRTIVVVNTVKRARELHEQIGSQWRSGEDQRLVLLHSRFRPPDRQRCIEAALADPPSGGAIIVSTQVIEAGVDVSAATLFTELAPWASLVQRFGRCNRRGEQNETASVRWIDLPTKKTDAESARFPYELADLCAAREQMEKLTDVGLGSLPNIELPFKHTHVIRKRDLIDLFDTTPDLAGNDIDIDRYVREVEDSDVRAFWREWERPKGHEPPPDDKAWRSPMRDELCSVPAGSKSNPGFRQFAKKHKGSVWRWNFIEGNWERVDDESAIYPGQTYLVHASAGGYDPDTGWGGPESKAAVDPIGSVEREGVAEDANDDEGLSKSDHWQTIAEHTDQVCNTLDDILASLCLNNDEVAALRIAARWHDWGKAHAIFQTVLPEGAPRADELWAKASKASGAWKRYRDVRRPHFRHELASALAVLQRPHDTFNALTDEDLNLVAYLIAAHHGKVRLSIRSLPNEARPPAANGQPRRFARGVWDSDVLPSVNLGGDIIAPAVTLSLEPMELGLCEQPPFADLPSWVERVIRLRATLGPFRLAYLEALLRAADWRASADANASCMPAQSGPQPHASEVGHG